MVKEFHNNSCHREGALVVLEWDLGTSRRESLLNTVLVLRSDLLQAVPRSLRWVTC